jgi:hypothetical protein
MFSINSKTLGLVLWNFLSHPFGGLIYNVHGSLNLFSFVHFLFSIINARLSFITALNYFIVVFFNMYFIIMCR